MNYNQNKKIAQITPQTLAIGVNIEKYKHVARAQDFRGIEFGKAFYFGNTNSDFHQFLAWIQQIVNPLHVKKSKELNDNSPTKNDVNDARVIAQLVKDGRYAVPNIPQGVYAELRVARKISDLLSVDMQSVQGQIHNWIDRFFPEFLTVFKD